MFHNDSPLPCFLFSTFAWLEFVFGSRGDISNKSCALPNPTSHQEKSSCTINAPCSRLCYEVQLLDLSTSNKEGCSHEEYVACCTILVTLGVAQVWTQRDSVLVYFKVAPCATYAGHSARDWLADREPRATAEHPGIPINGAHRDRPRRMDTSSRPQVSLRRLPSCRERSSLGEARKGCERIVTCHEPVDVLFRDDTRSCTNAEHAYSVPRYSGCTEGWITARTSCNYPSVVVSSSRSSRRQSANYSAEYGETLARTSPCSWTESIRWNRFQSPCVTIIDARGYCTMVKMCCAVVD